MNIPAQVQAQADRADQLLKGASTPETPSDEVAAASPEARDTKPSDDGIKPDEETVAYWKQRFEVVQGKYNSEVQALKGDVTLLSTLKNQVRQLGGQLQDANLLIADLQKQITEKPKATASEISPADQLSVLSDEERAYLREEGFEDKVVEIFGKMAGTLAKKEQQPAAAQIDTVEQIRQELRQEREATFWSKLDAGVVDAAGAPDWSIINSSDAFNDWLDERLPYSNKTRRNALQDAQAALDYVTVVQIFNDFKGQVVSKPKVESPYTPEKQIEPASSIAREAPDDKVKGKIYTRKEVKDFYKDQATGLYKGREAEAAKIDADILKANQEGRIKD